MKTTIYFVRHGDVFNPMNIWYGRLPRMSLSQQGKLRIEKTAKFLSNKKISTIYTSPLLRTRQTATIIANTLGINTIKTSSKILEVRSHLQGKSFSYIREIKANFFANNIRKEGDETINDIRNRMWKFCLKIDSVHNGKNIVAVSHGDPLMILKEYTTKGKVTFTSIRPGPEKYIKYGGVYKITLENNRVVEFAKMYNPAL